MKKYTPFLIVLALLCLAAATVVTPGKKVSEYPNKPNPPDNYLYLLTEANVTNWNITHAQLRLNLTNGLATTNYVQSATNAFAGSIGAVLWTNSVGIVMLTTNGPVSIASTGLLGGLVVTQDIRFLGHNSASNSVWVCTNATTGEGEWRTFAGSGIASQSELLWTNALTGINGHLRPKTTNVAFMGGGSNNTIISPAGFNVIGGGSENDIFANNTWGLIAGGFDNSVLSNTTFATLVGGQQNTAGSNHVFVGGGAANTARGLNSIVVGGDNNTANHNYGIVGGGSLNNVRGQFSLITGGSNNNIFAGTSGDGNNVISGGRQNQIGGASTFPSAYSVIAGGRENVIGQDCDHAAIGGGRLNTITGPDSTNSVIIGGYFNTVGAATGRKFSTILGGERNLVDANYAFALGGASNSVTAARAGAIGMNVTNSTAGSVTVGELISYNTPAVISGAGSGSTNYTLQVTSPKMLLGSSNVNIVAVMGWIDGKTHNWSVNITNLSADTWGITFSSATNRWKFQSWMYGTNAPSVLTNNTVLRVQGESQGTNTLVTYQYFAPGL